MKTPFLFALLLAACSQNAKEHYPQGFVANDRMYYWEPWLAHTVFGPNPVPRDPLSKDWVATDRYGNVYVSTELQAKMRK